ncbi:hypothetical protein SKAU_G00154670 [Synaphobranchus kaupii]|uniref:Uncharacterized protein n=1 Tax=Synaphobranchus kaupii TaxID=118154 RepID=A0A9Q1FHB4_SYNKA|nr:hypothetical protein SKAU_G00154670 [Synaphobranchus kaupii]
MQGSVGALRQPSYSRNNRTRQTEPQTREDAKRAGKKPWLHDLRLARQSVGQTLGRTDVSPTGGVTLQEDGPEQREKPESNPPLRVRLIWALEVNVSPLGAVPKQKGATVGLASPLPDPGQLLPGSAVKWPRAPDLRTQIREKRLVLQLAAENYTHQFYALFPAVYLQEEPNFPSPLTRAKSKLTLKRLYSAVSAAAHG